MSQQCTPTRMFPRTVVFGVCNFVVVCMQLERSGYAPTYTLASHQWAACDFARFLLLTLRSFPHEFTYLRVSVEDEPNAVILPKFKTVCDFIG